jgi:hypothetical protein
MPCSSLDGVNELAVVTRLLPLLLEYHGSLALGLSLEGDLLLGEASAASRGACRALPLLEPRTQRLAPISGIGSIDGLRQPDSLPSPRTKGEAL